jgi:hypothetical protein
MPDVYSLDAPGGGNGTAAGMVVTPQQAGTITQYSGQ